MELSVAIFRYKYRLYTEEGNNKLVRNHVFFCQPKIRHNSGVIKLQIHYYYAVRLCVELEQVTSVLAAIKKEHILIKEVVS